MTAMYIVMLGPPGAGKGTQAKKLAQALGLVHVSTGDLFRENLKNETELGKLAQTFMNAGELVPDDVTVRMVERPFLASRLRKRRSFGWLSPNTRPGTSPR